jgi:hypothetical protein
LPAYLPSRTNEYPNTNTPSKLPVEITELEGRKIIEKAREKKNGKQPKRRKANNYLNNSPPRLLK